MNMPVSGCIRACALLLVVLVALPVHADGPRSSAAAHKGHHGAQRAMADYYRGSGNLPNGVSIFNQTSANLPNGVSIFNRRNNLTRVPRARSGKKSHPSVARYDANEDSKQAHESSTRKRVGGASDLHGWDNNSHKKHAGDQRPSPVYANSVYIATPAGAQAASKAPAEEECRFLTERGYDRSGRRVLVEWTVCFDDRGTAYVPEEGRRILARY